MSEAVSELNFRRLVADESIPFTHRLLWVLLWEGEMRLDELLSLDVRDVDLEARTASVKFPKVGEPTVAPFSETAAKMLRKAIDGRLDGPLLVADSGQPLSREAAVRQTQNVGVSIHAFRLGGQLARSEPTEPAASS